MKGIKATPKGRLESVQPESRYRRKNNVSEQHPLIVERMVEAAKQWSQTHSQPLWFDNKKAEVVGPACSRAL